MVKYADSPTTTVDVSINAPQAEVWAYVSDINVPAKFSEEFVRAEWLHGATAPEVGATFRGYNKHAIVGEWNVECTVTDVEHEQTFEWRIGPADNKSAKWRFELTPEESGSRLEFTAEMGPGPSGLTPAIQQMPDREDDIVAGRLREWNANMQLTVDGIKDLAEGASSGDNA